MKFDGKEITTVWVDLDDTLIDFAANSRRSLEMLYEREELLQGLFDDAQAWAACYERHNAALWAQYNVGLIRREYLRAERFARPLMEAGLDRDAALEASGRYDTMYLDLLACQKKLVDGARELMEAMRKRGVRTGVLSNGFREVQFRKIDSAGLTGLIDTVVLSDDIQVNKPDVRLFEYAMERSGDSDPAHHLMIGDNPLTDITGALRAGWSAIWYHPVVSCPPSPCPYGAVEVHSLDAIMPMFE